MDKFAYAIVFTEFFLPIEKSFIFDGLGNMIPRFKIVMDLSNAQMIGFKIGLAYILAKHDKDATFIDLIMKRDDFKIFK